jgi:hypothetical protein
MSLCGVVASLLGLRGVWKVTEITLSEVEQEALPQTYRTSRTHSHKPLNLLTILSVGYIALKNN